MVPHVKVIIGEGENKKIFTCDGKLLAAESGYFASECQRATGMGIEILTIGFSRMTHDTWESIEKVMRNDYLMVSTANLVMLLPWICFLEMNNAMGVFDKKLSMHSDFSHVSDANSLRILDLFHITKRYGLKKARKKALNRVLALIVGICPQPSGTRYFERDASREILCTLDFAEKIQTVNYILGHLHTRSDEIQRRDGGEMATDLVHMVLLDQSEPVMELSHLRLIFCQYLINGEKVGSNIDGDLIQHRSPIEKLQQKLLSSIGVDPRSISGRTDQAELVYSYLVKQD